MKSAFLFFSILMMTSSVFAANDRFQCHVGLVKAPYSYDSKMIEINLNKNIADYPDSILGGSAKVTLQSHTISVFITHRDDPSTSELNSYLFLARVFETPKTTMLLEMKSKMAENALQNGMNTTLETVTPNLTVSLSCKKM
ncbi:hypothetical protein D3C87_260320 [compost metagenome]